MQMGRYQRWIARPSGVVACRLDAATGSAFLVFEPNHIVALPAMDGNRDGLQARDRRFGIYTPFSKLYLCVFVSHDLPLIA